MNNLLDYFDALERLKSGKPINVPKGTKITNDSVALEAGRKKGSIKKSRPAFNALIEEIERAKEIKSSKIQELELELLKEKQKTKKYREKYEAVLNDNLMLLNFISKKHNL